MKIIPSRDSKLRVAKRFLDRCGSWYPDIRLRIIEEGIIYYARLLLALRIIYTHKLVLERSIEELESSS